MKTYTKPAVELYGTFREFTQWGFQTPADSHGILGTVGCGIFTPCEQVTSS